MFLLAMLVLLTAAVLQPEYILPGWFLGLVPTLSYLINAVLFTLIERGTGQEMSSTAKRLSVAGVALGVAIILPLVGAIPMPGGPPTLGDPVALFGYAAVMITWGLTGATTIFMALEAAKATTVKRGTWLAPK